MINLKKSSFVIFGHSAIAGGMRPTAHGTFPSAAKAREHAAANMKETKFEVLTEAEAEKVMKNLH